MSDVDVQVLIVGAGPAGLTMACDLARRGVSHRIISAAEGGFEGSRAKGVQPRSLEVLDDLGVLPLLLPHSTLYPKLGLHLGPVTVPKTMIKIHEASEDVPLPNTLLAAQYATDTSLRQRLHDLGNEVEFGKRLVSYTQTDDAVTALVQTEGGDEEIRARYLVGADGGSSVVRKTAGIGFPGTTDENDRMIVADVSVEGLSRRRWHIWPRNAGRFMGLCPLPDGRFQLMLRLRPEEKADLEPEAVEHLVREFIGKAKITIKEIHWASVWRPNIRLAERYRDGRVLLVGDAAHVHPPTGGQGMNTGIQDAYNLGWKLQQVLAGAPDALLDTYQSERQPVAARVLGLSSEIYSTMSNQPLAAATRGDEERQLALSYAGGPLAPLHGALGTTLKPGDRAPDATYIDEQGRTGRLHEAFRGPHFTLVVLGADAAPALAWPTAGAEVRTLVVPSPGPGLHSIFGVTAPTFVLVRPDGYIGALDADGSVEMIEQFLAAAAPQA